MRTPLSRRDILERCLAVGVVTAALPAPLLAAAWDQAEQASPKPPTPPNDLGPFYKRGAPSSAQLRLPGDAGLALAVAGQLVNTRGEALRDARIEIWHADHFGKYDLEGYHFRSLLAPDEKGAYAFDSVMPGHYPARVAQHVHYLVTAPGHKPLSTQLYFATDPAFEGDPDHNYGKDPLVVSRERIRPVRLVGDPGTMSAAVTFDLCLEPL